MSRHRSRRAITVVELLLLAVLTIGCGRRGIPSGDAAPSADLATALPTAALAEQGASQPTTPIPSDGVATEPPVASPAATPPPAPLAPPDLSAIERLLDDLDAALGDDAAAGSDEGSPK